MEQQWTNRPVVDEHHAKIGKVTDVFFGERGEEPQFAAVKTGLLAEHLAPLDGRLPGRRRDPGAPLQPGHRQARPQATPGPRADPVGHLGAQRLLRPLTVRGCSAEDDGECRGRSEDHPGDVGGFGRRGRAAGPAAGRGWRSSRPSSPSGRGGCRGTCARRWRRRCGAPGPGRCRSSPGRPSGPRRGWRAPMLTITVSPGCRAWPTSSTSSAGGAEDGQERAAPSAGPPRWPGAAATGRRARRPAGRGG